MSGISIVGGGIAGLVAGITCAEAEVEATIFEGAAELDGAYRIVGEEDRRPEFHPIGCS